MRNGRKSRIMLAWMNGFLEFHMARSNIEMQRKRNRDGVLNSYLSFMSHSYVPIQRHINVCIVIIYHNCPKTAIIFGNLSKILPILFLFFRLCPPFSDRTGQRKSEDPNNDSRFLSALWGQAIPQSGAFRLRKWFFKHAPVCDYSQIRISPKTPAQSRLHRSGSGESDPMQCRKNDGIGSNH